MNTNINLKSQTISMETLGNARELGGYRTLDGRAVKHGLLLRSAKPRIANESELLRLKNEYNLATIVDFRMSYERMLEPNPAIPQVIDVWCPIIDEDLISANIQMGKRNSKNAPNMFERLKIAVDAGIVSDKMYVNFLANQQGKTGYADFFKELLALPEGKALLFHCTQGKDRTGLGAMLILSALGLDEETIMAQLWATSQRNWE